jgi:hypothetical protein
MLDAIAVPMKAGRGAPIPLAALKAGKQLPLFMKKRANLEVLGRSIEYLAMSCGGIVDGGTIAAVMLTRLTGAIMISERSRC